MDKIESIASNYFSIRAISYQYDFGKGFCSSMASKTTEEAKIVLTT